MAFQRGQPRPTAAGRRSGVPNKVTAKRAAEIAASGQTPLEYMLSVMRDAEADASRRDDMAKAAAPYCHARLASVEHSGKEGAPPIKIESLSDAQLDILIGRLAAGSGSPDAAAAGGKGAAP